MIITVKTNGKEIEALSGNCVKHTAKKSQFSINAKDLSTVLAIIYSEGYTRTKIDMESQDKKELIGEFNTKSPMEYLEHILAKEIKNLEKDKNVLSFLKEIKFPKDSCQNVKVIYDTLVEKNIELKTTTKAHIYIYACREGFGNGVEGLKDAIRKWVIKYYPDYIEHMGKSVPYDVFLKLLLKHTGCKY